MSVLDDMHLSYLLNEQGEVEPVNIHDGSETERQRYFDWWAQSWEPGAQCRRVAVDEVGEWRISTVFLGINHQFGFGPPVLWETMVFGPEPWDQWQDRYTSREAAETGHAAVVARIRHGLPPSDD